MNNRINQLFQEKDKNILSVYFTAGYPELNDTVTIIQELEKNGVNLIEIGMPFSDPVADGPVIQNSSLIALKNGMSVKKLFEQLQNIRKTVKIPLILMGYLNPVLQFGVENFCKKCQEVGIDGLIIPDLPLNEYLSEYKSLFEAHQLHNILLITPQTSDERILQIDAESSGFIYMVSSSSTTGMKQSVAKYQTEYFERVNRLGLKNPQLIGFGISNHETFQNTCKYAGGAIIGSAFVKALEGELTLNERISGFVKTIVNPE
ncbi:MAG: tryptophan synthase subunit alpha [Bacteroidetes bacterium GWF2_42_66]|nr:MAG: tryptophan synthase subunit alpha [Bacteroidetes bacterium GWA2_42_15]OFX99239.1 MAG: tryptophan synthase subunit alpha [Bacteroidetes bacterium GWE2_42_39]OFY40635.1 MAG: tryptophan synthase subunit alpha [Bacteroidetes bacterium GWF2_42_66]HAZ03316.1 tryptophan synthase subunit alpha [Marinilabiliales bacterium]HBL76586.1 tryptophan synthase subunit alpha [Prolixibacteraceae bacterium]